MDSRIGLDYIVDNPEYITKLAAGNSLPLASTAYFLVFDLIPHDSVLIVLFLNDVLCCSIGHKQRRGQETDL